MKQNLLILFVSLLTASARAEYSVFSDYLKFGSLVIPTMEELDKQLAQFKTEQEDRYNKILAREKKFNETSEQVLSHLNELRARATNEKLREIYSSLISDLKVRILQHNEKFDIAKVGYGANPTVPGLIERIKVAKAKWDSQVDPSDYPAKAEAKAKVSLVEYQNEYFKPLREVMGAVWQASATEYYAKEIFRIEYQIDKFANIDESCGWNYHQSVNFNLHTDEILDFGFMEFLTEGRGVKKEISVKCEYSYFANFHPVKYDAATHTATVYYAANIQDHSFVSWRQVVEYLLGFAK